MVPKTRQTFDILLCTVVGYSKYRKLKDELFPVSIKQL